MKLEERNEFVSELRDAMAEALYPVFRKRQPPSMEEDEVGRVVLWSMLTLAVDVSLTLRMPLDEVQDFCGRVATYAENAQPVREAEVMTAHLRRGVS